MMILFPRLTRYSISSVKFQEFISELGKIFFPLGNEPTGNFWNATEFLTLGKALPILLPIYFKMLIMQILTQTDNLKYNKSVAIKKV